MVVREGNFKLKILNDALLDNKEVQSDMFNTAEKKWHGTKNN